MSTPRGPVRPEITEENADFWEGCRAGVIRLPRCTACGWVQHPPGPVCARCHATDLVPHELGRDAVIVGFTVSHQSFRPDLEAPYALAIVRLIEAPGVQLTVRVAGAGDPVTDGLAVGAPVRLELEPVDGATDGDVGASWAVPVAVLTGAAAPAIPPPTPPPAPRVALRVASPKPESAAVISGVAMSEVGRKLRRSGLALTIESALAAIADAGLQPSDIDGLAAYPGAGIGPPGYAGPRTDDVADALGVSLAWHRAGAEGAGQLQPVIDAVLAVAAGLCNHVLVFRTATESTATALMREGLLAPPALTEAAGFMGWLAPFDSVSPAHWLAPYAQAHMHHFGTTREQLGAIAVNARANAVRTPGAALRSPLTLEEHLAARMISSPFGLLDCDVPVDGSVAIVVSRADAESDLRAPVVRFEAVGAALGGRPSWDQAGDLTEMSATGAARSMWARTALGPADVDVAELYDGFSFLALSWLEALGFCATGEGGPFVEDGRRIALDGELPLATSGGQLSFGRLHGWGLLHEACVQLRREAGDRQVGDAEVAVVSAGGGPIAGCLLLTR